MSGANKVALKVQLERYLMCKMSGLQDAYNVVDSLCRKAVRPEARYVLAEALSSIKNLMREERKK